MIIYGSYYSQHIFILYIAVFFLVLGFLKRKCQLIRDLFIIFAMVSIVTYITLTFVAKGNFKTFKKNYFKNLQIEEKLSDDDLIKVYENLTMSNMKKLKKSEKN